MKILLAILISLSTLPAFAARSSCEEQLTSSLAVFDGRIRPFEEGRDDYVRTGRGWIDHPESSNFLSVRGIGGAVTQLLANTQHPVDSWQDKRIVDLGTGDGQTVFDLREMGIEAEGIDLMLNEEQKQYPFFYEADMTDTGLASKTYDVAISAYAIFHYEEQSSLYRAALEEAYRILKPGGFFVIVAANERTGVAAILGSQFEVVSPSRQRLSGFGGGPMIDIVLRKRVVR